MPANRSHPRESARHRWLAVTHGGAVVLTLVGAVASLAWALAQPFPDAPTQRSVLLALPGGVVAALGVALAADRRVPMPVAGLVLLATNPALATFAVAGVLVFVGAVLWFLVPALALLGGVMLFAGRHLALVGGVALAASAALTLACRWLQRDVT